MQTDHKQIDSVLVLGGGSAGLLAAYTIKKLIPELSVTVVCSRNIAAIGVGESTTASLPAFLHRDLQLDRRAFYEAVRPSWKLGIRFLWGPDSTAEFYYPFRSQFECPELFRQSNAHYGLEDYERASLFAELMRGQRSACLRTPDGQLQVDDSFGYHIDTDRLARYLHQQAVEIGIGFEEGRVDEVRCVAGERCDGIRLDDGRWLQADLYVDASGFSSRLLGQSLRTPFYDYSGSLFCDRAVVGSWVRDDRWLPYTTAQTMRNGWCWRIDLPDRISRGYVYASRFCSDDEAAAEFVALCPQLSGDPLRVIPFRSGRYRDFWVGNVAAVGNAAGFVEPLESTGLHMIAETITALTQALLDGDRFFQPPLQRLANRFVGEMWDDIRDFLAVHFRFNGRNDSSFWRHCRAASDLAGAQQAVDFYQTVGPSRIGHMMLPPQSVFGWRGYVELLRGLAVPTRFRMTASAPESTAWTEHCRHVTQIAQHALTMEAAFDALAARGWAW